MGSWPMIHKVHTCIVYLDNQKSIKGLMAHLIDTHPPRTTKNFMAQTDQKLQEYWVNLLRSMYGQETIKKIVNRNVDIVDGSIIKF
ncbi:hypothetical protein GCK72_009231 [Caenorhabditis remanei]|uniref:Uncharacterized protein n=1 Tax=Caenorhabditis remanei TaxID=31234 RepID=A0A6A5GZQ4_CAERE|nr:hypothetical protein GCK72_009231 [Caenorhabditis remanei]KAF1760978.1 hypothetical protein GCK72_009231 [Caenorhabditis remanei]